MTVGELYTELLELVTDNPHYSDLPIRTANGFDLAGIDVIHEEGETFLELSVE